MEPRNLVILLIVVLIILFSYNYKGCYLDKKKSLYEHEENKTCFDENLLINPNTEFYNTIIEWFNNFCNKYDINYSITYGTLLGQVRDKNYIPYDDDMDLFIGKDDAYKLFDLYKNADKYGLENNIFLNSELKNKSISIDKRNEPIILLTSEHDNKIENKFRKRYDCKGNFTKHYDDICSFNGPVGRIIYKGKHCDLFVWSDYKINKNYSDECVEDKISKKTYCVYIATKYGTKLPETKKCKLNSVITRKFKNKSLNERILITFYGKNYLEPNKKFLNNKLVNL